MKNILLLASILCFGAFAYSDDHKKASPAEGDTLCCAEKDACCGEKTACCADEASKGCSAPAEGCCGEKETCPDDGEKACCSVPKEGEPA